MATKDWDLLPVVGTLSVEARNVIAGFNPTYMKPFDGFTR
jgi:hypothetical protein